MTTPNNPIHQKAGLEWCMSLGGEIEDRLDEIPVLEVIPENFFSSLGNVCPKTLFAELNRREIPVLVHSIGLSLCSIEPFKQDYFDRIKAISDQIEVIYSFSDHLCMTEKDGSEIGQLTTSPYNQATLDTVCRKIEQIQKQTNAPFAIENITHVFMIPDQEYEETEFIRQIIDRTGAKLLLDVNNIYTNGVNFGIDPYEWLSRIDLAQVDSIHLAGGFFDEENFLQDGHCAKVPEPVWELFDHIIKMAERPIASIVERTGQNEEQGLRPVMEDRERAQAILDKHCHGIPLVPEKKPEATLAGELS